MVAKTRIVQIGNSRGFRVPKAFLQEARLPANVELVAEPGRLIVQAASGPREGWADAARTMRQRDGDRSELGSTPTRFDRDEWKWR